MSEWRKVKLADICTFIKGETGISKANPGEYPLVVTGKERKTCDSFQFDTKAVCIPLVSSAGHGKASLNYVHYQEGKFALGSILVAVIPKDENVINAQFLHLYLSRLKDLLLVPLMKGTANVSLSVALIKSIEISLPKIKRQIEIVNLFNQLDLDHQELAKENTNQQTYLTKLRQAILQEAIEGKLTADWRVKNPVEKGNPDFDAVALLEKIKAEKQKLIAEGKIKKEKPLAPINADDVPFVLPDGWIWVRLGECSLNRDDARKPISQTERGRKNKIYPYYGASGVIDKIDGYTHEGKNLLIGEDGANLVSRSTPIAFIADGQYWVNNHAHVIGFTDSTILFFVKIHVNAIDLKPYVTGGFQPKLNQSNLNNIFIAFPPLAEQHAIVARVDRLLASVNSLEQQVQERKTYAQQLMQAVLKEAFAE